MNYAASAYQQAAKAAALTPRQVEARALMNAAARIKACADKLDGWSRELDDALMHNRKLWTVLVTSATAPENPLPLAIKNNIANIAVFVFKRTMEMTAAPTKAGLDALVELNGNIAAGLRGDAG